MASVQVRSQLPHFGRLALWMRQHQNTRDSFDRLKRERTLAFQFVAALFSTRQEFRVPRFCLCEATLCALHTALNFFIRSTNLLVCFLNQLGEREFDMFGDMFNFSQTFSANLFQEWHQCLRVQPIRRFFKT